MNRDDIQFPPRHAPLRDDVHALGALVGEILREQGGEQLFELVELDRVAAIRARAGESAAEAHEARYRILATPPDHPHVEVQQVTHESRVHLDIEADDIEAEVARLERLGARRIAAVKSWQVMEAPTGQRFCVVSVQRADFATKANSWET